MRLTFNIQNYAQHSGLLMSPGIVVEEDGSPSSRASHSSAARYLFNRNVLAFGRMCTALKCFYW